MNIAVSLEDKEIEAFRTIANIQCATVVECESCPLKVQINGTGICVRNLVSRFVPEYKEVIE